MRANYDWTPGDRIIYHDEDNNVYGQGVVVEKDWVSPDGLKHYIVNPDTGNCELMVPYDNVLNEDDMEQFSDVAKVETCAKYSKPKSSVNELTFSYLSRVFGESFVWTSRTLEIVGYSDMYNAFVVIDDGMCHSDCGWHTLIYSFIDAHITAKDWFNDKGKYYTGKDVHTQEFWLNGVDAPAYKL